MTTTNYSMTKLTELPDYDALDVVLLCHAALAQDSPELPTVYLNQILNIMFGYLTSDQRQEVEVYLAEKKYLPPVKLLDNTGGTLDTNPVIVTDK